VLIKKPTNCIILILSFFAVYSNIKKPRISARFCILFAFVHFLLARARLLRQKGLLCLIVAGAKSGDIRTAHTTNYSLIRTLRRAGVFHITKPKKTSHFCKAFIFILFTFVNSIRFTRTGNSSQWTYLVYFLELKCNLLSEMISLGIVLTSFSISR
jgi:hypothetical protein